MSKLTQQSGLHSVRHGWFLLKSRRAMWQMIREVVKGHYRMSFLTIAVLLLSLAYVVFPFDLIPDHILIFGWTDDMVVLYLSIRRLAAETQRYSRWKAMERKHA